MTNLFDSANAPEGEPTSAVVGDFVQWKRSDLSDDYSNSSYTAKYIFHKADGTGSDLTITGTALNDDFLFTITSTVSDRLPAGDYVWQLEIIRNSDSSRIVVDRGNFKFLVDLLTPHADGRIHAEIMVAKIESILEGKADSDVSSYSIAGRSLTKMNFDELTAARDKYRGEVTRYKNKELAKRGKAGSSTVKVRFS